MPAYTFFHPFELSITEEIELSEEESHHALSVMRLEAGEPAFVLNGRGQEAKAVVLPSKKRCHLKIESITRQEQLPSRQLCLLQGLTSIAKADLIVEKLTELGIDEISFFAAERSGRQKMNEHQQSKLEHKTIQACKQSGRLWLPTLKWYDTLEDCVREKSTHSTHLWITLDPHGEAWKESFSPVTNRKAYTLVVGPESGLSEHEIETLDALGAKRLNIHTNILRAETAALAGACLLYHYAS